MNFTDMNIDPQLVQALRKIGITEPTEIQEQAIPAIKSSNGHLLAQAKTGTGKTFAFAIPIIEALEEEESVVQAVIIVPTRELCKQVSEAFSALTKYQNFSIVEVYGGVSINRQLQKIRQGAQIVVATPGRLIDIYRRRGISFRNVDFVVLDEADRMLDMGFFPDIQYILLKAMKQVHPRLLLFSATLLESIQILFNRFVNGEEVIKIDVSHDTLTVENCNQYFYLIERKQDKFRDFLEIVKHENPFSCIIFVNTKRGADSLYRRLRRVNDFDLKVAVLQGDMTQKQREYIFKQFKAQKINCLVATNVAARGLDFPHVSHVFNYDMPNTEESYVHRIGRTSRMERQGTAISLCLREEHHLIHRIELFMNSDIIEKTLPNRRRQSRRAYSRRHYGPRHH